MRFLESQSITIFTDFLNDNAIYQSIGFIPIPNIMLSFHSSTPTKPSADIIPLLAHTHDGYVRIPSDASKSRLPVLDESNMLASSKAHYVTQRYITLTNQVLMVSFCTDNDDDDDNTHHMA